MKKRTIAVLLSIMTALFCTACSSTAGEDSAAGAETFSIAETIPADDGAGNDDNAHMQDPGQKTVTTVVEEAMAQDETVSSPEISSSEDSIAGESLTDGESSEREEGSSENTESVIGNVETTGTSSTETTEGETTEADPDLESNDITIVLDPGHSSKISGNTEPLGPGSSEMKAADSIGTHGDASGLMEYQLNLIVCQKAEKVLEQEGYNVILTRQDSETPISCAARAEIANKANADAFIRVHANGADAASANGAMTICITSENPYTPETYGESSRLSETLLNAYCAATGRRKERVWYTDSMTGNNWSKVPTTLLEMGYMTNQDEDLWMASEEGQNQIIKGIVDGINTYFGQY